jgi:molecular chaperone GrpE
MMDAVEAVEAREKSRGSPRAGDDGEQEGPASAGAAEAGDSPAGEGAAEALLAAKNELDQVIKKSQADLQELKDKWLRSAADLENYKKRAVREKEEILKFANERLLKDLLPVLDDTDRTLEASTQSTPADAGHGSLVEGLRMVQKKFLAQLEKHGVTSFATVGQAFDPNLHEAVQQANSDQVPAGGVAAEARRGFLLNGRLLRPALVVVSLGPKSSA